MTMRFIDETMRDAGACDPLRVTAAFSDGRRIYALRHASDAAPETLYVRDRKTRAGTLIVSEPLDDGRDDWKVVPPQSFVTVGPEGLSIAPFQLGTAA
jgi:predicted glutamine amidotransferase